MAPPEAELVALSETAEALTPRAIEVPELDPPGLACPPDPAPPKAALAPCPELAPNPAPPPTELYPFYAVELTVVAAELVPTLSPDWAVELEALFALELEPAPREPAATPLAPPAAALPVSELAAAPVAEAAPAEEAPEV